MIHVLLRVVATVVLGLLMLGAVYSSLIDLNPFHTSFGFGDVVGVLGLKLTALCIAGLFMEGIARVWGKTLA